MRYYGADYYPEHWDPRVWDSHIEWMKRFGIEWVRVGEFTWSLVEPRDGEFDFSLLDKAIGKLKDAGLRVMLGTPTATPPAWLVRKYPEVLPVDFSGRVRGFGSRRHYSTNSKVFRDYALRITEAYAQRYGSVVDAWQVDNELGCHGTTFSFSEADLKAFIAWLQNKYGAIENLNGAWGTVFWSQRYSSWDEICFPINTPTFENPHQMLDVHRFMSESSVLFLAEQVKVIKKYSNAPVTHNFMVDFTDIDYRKMAKFLDFVSWDNYVATETYDPFRQSANHSLMRSLKKMPFLVVEQQPGRVNWRHRNETYDPPFVGLWIKQGYLCGASGVFVFRFDQIRFGAEQYHAGLMDYAGRPTGVLEEFKRVKDETSGVVEPVREVAIYFDYEVDWMHRINHVNRSFRYWDSVVEVYKATRSLGYNVDFVFPDEDFSGYRVLVIPYAMELSESVVSRIKAFNGLVILTCMGGLKDERNWIVERAPCGLIEEFGVEVRNFGAIERKAGRVGPLDVTITHWLDEVDVFDARVVGAIEGGEPLVIERDTPLGPRVYVASVLDLDGWKVLLSKYLNPRVVGDGVEITNTTGGTYCLNLFRRRNVFFLNGTRAELGPFEMARF